MRCRPGWNCTPGSAGYHSKHSSSPTISYSRNGFLVLTDRRGWAAQVPFASQPGFADAFMPGGRAPSGILPLTTATLKIAATNGEEFYRGELAPQTQAHSAANSEVMRADDLAARRVDWVDTITGTTAGAPSTRCRPTAGASWP